MSGAQLSLASIEPEMELELVDARSPRSRSTSR
jgi:hypothetical protein